MALDTRNKRAAAIGVGSPIPAIFPDPDGTIDADNRAQMCWSYVLLLPIVPSAFVHSQYAFLVTAESRFPSVAESRFPSIAAGSRFIAVKEGIHTMVYAAAYVKDPDAVLDYGFDWSDWLATGETISTSAWTIEAGLTEDSASNTDTVATVWLSGGTAGTCYEATNEITTSGSRTDNRTLLIEVSER